MRLKGYGSESEILKMFMVAKFEGWALEVERMAAGLEALDLERRRNALGKLEEGRARV